MARRRKPPRPDLDKPGLPPLLQGHLNAGGVRPGDASSEAAGQPNGGSNRSAQPTEDVAVSPNQSDAVSGKATKSPADVATRPHLEGSEQGPS